MSTFSTDCHRCSRLAKFLSEVKGNNPDYYALPVPPFGPKNAKLLIVGLAPGMHGANRTGRPFTGDYAGILLYKTLYEYGFSNKPESLALNDGLKLKGCRITNAVKCLPPQNKPTGGEVNTCNVYLAEEIDELKSGSVIIALGSIAHNAVLKSRGLKQSQFKFGHAAIHQLDEHLTLVDSYHCSRYNTQTKRLTPEMFKHVFQLSRELLESK